MIYTNIAYFKKRLRETGTDSTLDNSNQVTQQYLAALKKFQAGMGLTPDGIVGDKTLNLLVPNFKKDVPVVPYQKIAVPEADVIAYVDSLFIKTEVKRSVFIVVYNEAAAFNSLVGGTLDGKQLYNIAGIQEDNAPWSKMWDKYIKATTVKCESMTGNPRRFALFDTWQHNIDMVAYYMYNRGVYIGGDASAFAGIKLVRGLTPVALPDGKTEDMQYDLYAAYYRAWVIGDKNAQIKIIENVRDFTKLYAKAEKIFA